MAEGYDTLGIKDVNFADTLLEKNKRTSLPVKWEHARVKLEQSQYVTY